MRRLYLQVYLAFVGILVLFGVLISLAWWLLPGDIQTHGSLEGMSAVLGEVLPAPERPLEDLQRKVDWLAARFDADVTVRAPDGQPLARSGAALPAPPPGHPASGWLRGAGAPAVALRLADGRWVVARWKHRHNGLAGTSARWSRETVASWASSCTCGPYPLRGPRSPAAGARPGFAPLPPGGSPCSGAGSVAGSPGPPACGPPSTSNATTPGRPEYASVSRSPAS